MNKKVAMIIERADATLGGAERSVFELAGAISQLGPEVDILAAKGRADGKNVHILCRDKPGRRTSYRAFARALKQHISANHYNIIHSTLPFDFADVYQPRGGTYAESILRNAASYRSSLIESYKKLTAFANFRRARLLRAERNLCQRIDRPVIVAISQYVKQQFRQHYAVADERIAVIPNGIEISTTAEAKESDRLRLQILSRLGVSEADEPILLLFAANNFRLKGLAVLIEAMRLADSEVTQRPVFLVAVGNDKKHKYYRLAKKLDIAERIIFLGSVGRIQSVLAMCDVAVLPTFYDPSSRFVLEALAAGKPVITTKFNGATDLFVNNRHGVVIDKPEDSRALAEAIGYFTSKDRVQKASQLIAADNLKEKISIHRVAKELISLYESIVQQKGGN
jgi:UDP-glucose:(heptosyl)LPS alpha-1,3-glucosyltransferase